MLKRYLTIGTCSSFVFILLLFCLVFHQAQADDTPAVQIPTEAVGQIGALDAHATPLASTVLHLTFALISGSQGGAADYVNSLTDPQSPNFHKWITAKQYGEKFGAASQDINSVVNDLTTLGLTNITVWPDRMFVSADATKIQAEAAFGLSINGYDRSSNDIALGFTPTYYAPSRNPQVDKTLAARLTGIYGLSNASERRPAEPLIREQPMFSSQGFLDPPDLAKAYNISALHSLGLEGQGETIAIFSPTGFQLSDLTRFLAANNIVSPKINIVNVNGGNTNLADQVEACIDIETIIGQAPLATVNVYEGPNDGSFNIFLQVENDDPDILSESYRIDENEVNASYAQSYESIRQTMAAEGISIFVASGDYGAYDSVNQTQVVSSLDAASNYVTAVGGTELTLNAGAWNGETAWSYKDGTTGGNTGSAGGLSIFYPRQSWQTGLGVSNSNSNQMRQIPDVSALASRPYYDISTEGGFSGWAGTSCSTPLWASATALVEQGIGSRLGNIDSALYGLATTNSSIFHDITSGNNGVYSCTTGWDYVTGWGSVDFGKLYAAFPGNSTKVTSFTPSGGTAGTQVTITGTAFIGATSVFIGGVAATIVSNSANQIVAQVAANAVTGPIVVITPTGTGVSISPFTVYQGSYFVTANPSSVTVSAGSSGSSTLSLNNNPGFSGAVSLSVSGLPTGVTATISPSTIAGNATSVVTFTASSTSAVGTWIVTISGASGFSYVSSTLSLTINSNLVLSSIALSPATVTLAPGGTQQFTATGKDQFGNALSPQPTFAWSVSSGVGSILQTGNYSAGLASGSATIAAKSGGFTGTATVTVSNAPPTVVNAAAATPNPVTGTTTNLSVLGADDGGQSNLTYKWSTTGSPPAPVSFSASGTNAAQSTVATFSSAGTYTILATISDAFGLSVTSSVTVVVNQTLTSISVSPASVAVTVPNTQTFTATAYDQFGNVLSTQPTLNYAVSGGGSIGLTNGVFTAATPGGPFTVTASAGSVNGTATVTVNPAPSFSMLANSNALSITQGSSGSSTISLVNIGGFSGSASLAASGLPSGVTAAFSPGSISGSSTSLLTLTAAPTAALGTSTITVTGISGPLTETASVSLTVVSNQVLSSITVSPNTASVALDSSQQFIATAKDQFGTSMSTQPAISWSIAAGGVGSISQGGLYSSAGTSGTATVVATSGSVTGTSSVTVVATAPTIVSQPSATPNPVTGSTTNLSVLGADDLGQGSLRYAWTAIGSPPAPVTFSVNNGNSAQNTVASFTAPGTYTLRVVISDPLHLTAVSQVVVTVNQTLTTISVTPSAATVIVGGSQTFSATGYDQFGNAMSSQPSYSYAVSGGGSIGLSSGAFLATTAGGPFMVTAASGAATGSAAVTVNGPAQFALSAAPGAVSAPQGTTANTVVALSQSGSYSGTVSLTASGLPAGVTMAFSPASITGSSSSTLTFTVSPTATVGTSTITVTGTSGSQIQTTTLTLTVTANSILTSISVSPVSASLSLNGTQQFVANAKDQNGTSLAVQPAITWSIISGVGSVAQSGVYTAGATAGSATVSATSGSVSGMATVTITAQPPTIVNQASATPNPVVGTTTNLSVLATDDLGPASVQYKWSTMGTPPGPVTFSANSSNAAQNSVATFTKAGAYSLRVVASDPVHLTNISSVTLVVNQTLTSIVVTPGTSTVANGSMETFSAIAYDQFGTAMSTQPTFTFTVSGGGTIGSTSGVFSATSVGGPVTVTASSASLSGTAVVTVI